MAKHLYKVASEEGAQKYGAEIGETVDLDITDEDEKRAVIAAGWLEHTKPAKDDKS